MGFNPFIQYEDNMWFDTLLFQTLWPYMHNLFLFKLLFVKLLLAGCYT